MAFRKDKFLNFLLFSLILLICALCFSFSVQAQKIAILTPEKNDRSASFAESLKENLSKEFKILDKSLSESAFDSATYDAPFNLSLEEAKNIGSSVGCDYFLLVQSKTLRRSSLTRKEFYESYAAVYVVSSRSGRLVFWKLVNAEAKDANESEKILLRKAESSAIEISKNINDAEKTEVNIKIAPKLEELPAENSPDTENFRPPLPYKRFRPQYTEIADFYNVEATIDITLDISENGKILRTEISRWAGFGLDESVEETASEMIWRPADRDGKTLPMRILLRYNFKKIDEK